MFTQRFILFHNNLQSHEIHRLETYTQYLVSLQVFNPEGPGPATTVLVMTDEGGECFFFLILFRVERKQIRFRFRSPGRKTLLKTLDMESAVKISFDAVLERINTLFIKVKLDKKIAFFHVLILLWQIETAF